MGIASQYNTAQVKTTNETLLDRLLQTPARRPILEAIFWQMPRYISAQRSSTLNSSVQWQVTGRADGGVDHYRLDFSDGTCRVRRGTGDDQPGLTVTLSAGELVRLVTRRSNPVAAFFTGRITIAGNAMVAAKLGALFLEPAQRTGR
jgi:putative sterol carrier protein